MYDAAGTSGLAALPDGRPSGSVETPLLGTREGFGLGRPIAGGAASPADGGTQIFSYGGVWHARRQILNGRIVMGIGFTQELAVADLEAQWSVA